jgi:drug/metabolite transporter (DMT)-like permease
VQHRLGLLYLNLATLLWGASFILIKDSLRVVSAEQLLWLRFLIASVCFIPFLWQQDKKLWRSGLELGFWLWIAYATQTIGLQYTTASRSAFITALYVIFIPLLLGLLGQRVGRWIWLAALLAFAGVGMISYDGSPPNLGDLWTVACALGFAIYIWRLEQLATFAPLPLTGIQMLTSALLSSVWVSVSWKTPAWESLPWLSLIYLGVVTSAICIWLQTLGQRHVSASQAAIIFTLEPIYTAIFAFVFLSERLGPSGWLGAALVIVAALVSSLTPKGPLRGP